MFAELIAAAEDDGLLDGAGGTVWLVVGVLAIIALIIWIVRH